MEFEILAQKYIDFEANSSSLDQDELAFKAMVLLEELRKSGRLISNPQERDILSGWCRGLGGKIYEITGEYPAVRIATLSEHASFESYLHNVPDLPPSFLPRPDDLEAVKRALMANTSSTTAITGMQSRVGLYGMGGIGKSVLAAAVARDEEIRNHFTDGIFWLTLGTEPDIIRRQSDLAKMLDSESHTFVDAAQGRVYLGESLAYKVCLIVLDDVWHAEDVTELFGDVGLKCRILITTRDAGIIKSLQAREHQLGLLNDEKSMELLAKWAEEDIDTLPPEASQIIKECGNLPLALALCGAQVKEGTHWKHLLEALQEAALQFLDHPQGSVMKSIKTGIDVLTFEQAKCYKELVVFPPDESVPEEAILTFWTHANELKERDARRILLELARKALLKINKSERAGDSTIELHDLQHDYLRTDCQNIKNLHNLLLGAYSKKTSNGIWPTGPNDGYFFQHLAYHLSEAGRLDDLESLLFDFNWIQKKLLALDSAIPVVSDYDLARSREDIYQVQKAIRFSANVIDRDHSQLPSQLLGRLIGFDLSRIQDLLNKAREATSYPWLRPQTPCLISSSRGISAIVITPDNRKAVTGSSYREIEIWDLETGQEIRTLKGHDRGISSIAISHDGRKILSGSADHTIKVWDLENGKEKRTLTGHTDTVFSVAISLDGQIAISGSNDCTAKVWDLETGTEKRTLTGHTDSIYSVAISPDGQLAISGSDDCLIKVWDLKTGQNIKTLKGHTDWISAVAVIMSSNGQKVVSGSWDHMIKIWDLETGKEIRTLKGHNREVSSIAIFPDGQKVVSGSWDNTAMVWDLKTGEKILTLEGHNREVGAVAVSPDGRRVISGSWDHTAKVWDLEAGQELLTLKGHTIGISAIAVSPDGQRAVSGSSDGIITIWVADGKEGKSFEAHTDLIYSVALTEDGRRAISGSSDNTIKEWDLETRKEIRTIKGPNKRISALFVHPDGKKAVSGSDDGTINVWDLETGKEIRTLKGHTKEISRIIIAPSGQRAVSLSDDDTIKVWDLETYQEIMTFEGNTKEFRAIAVTPDSQRVITGSSDGAIKIWDFKTGKKIENLKFHESSVFAIAVFLDNRTAISGSDDGTIVIWDLETKKRITTFSGGSMTAVAVARDERNIIAGDNEGRIHFLVLENMSKLHEETGRTSM